MYGPSEIGLGRKSAFPSTPTQTLVTESCMCEQFPPPPTTQTQFLHLPFPVPHKYLAGRLLLVSS